MRATTPELDQHRLGVNLFLVFFILWMVIIIGINYFLAFRYDATGIGDTHLVPIHTPYKVPAPYDKLPQP